MSFKYPVLQYIWTHSIIQVPSATVTMKSCSTTYATAHTTGRDDLNHIVRVVLNRSDIRATEILQAFDNAGINDAPSLLHLDIPDIENFYLVNAEGIQEKLKLGSISVLLHFFVLANNLTGNSNKTPIWQELTYLMYKQSLYHHFIDSSKNRSNRYIKHAFPNRFVTSPKPNVDKFIPRKLLRIKHQSVPMRKTAVQKLLVGRLSPLRATLGRPATPTRRLILRKFIGSIITNKRRMVVHVRQCIR